MNFYNIKKDFFSKNSLVFLSYFTVFAIIVAVYAILGIYPFGEFTIIKSDLFHSYAPVLNDVRTKILSGQSILHTWNGGLGGNLFVPLVTVATSPFNLIMFLFPVKYTTEMIAALLLVKIPFGAVTFFLYIRNKYNKNDVTVIIFSILYGLCAYVTSLYWNIMFLDSVIWLPLVALGIDKLYADCRSKFYCISLAAAIFSNYGTAIYLCCFSVVYFFFNYLLTENPRKEDRRRLVLRFAWYSLISGFISAILLLPTLKGLQGSEYLREGFPNSFEFYFSVFRFYTSHFFGMHPTALVFSNSVPNVYAGVLSIFLLPFYFLNKSIDKKKKLLYGGFLLVLFLFFDINILTFIIHGFHFPSMMPHRFSFVYSFVMLVMAFEAFQNLEETKNKHLFGIYGVTMAVLPVLYYFNKQNIDFPKPGRLSIATLVANLIFVTTYFGIIFLYKYRNSFKVKKILIYILVGVVIVEAAGNTYIQFKHMNDGRRERYALEFYDSMEEVSQTLTEEPELYRAEFKHHVSLTESRIYDYNGLNAFTMQSVSMREMLDKIGVSASMNVSAFINPSPVIYSLFNQKYLFNRRTRMQESFTLFEYKKQVGNVFLYENPYALPVGYMVNEDLLGFDFDDDDDNPYILQNDFVRRATGFNGDIFAPVGLDTVTTEFITLSPSEKENVFSYEIDENVTSDMIPLICFIFAAPESKYTVFHVRTGGATKAEVSVNGDLVMQQSYRRGATSLDAGFVEQGSKVEVKMYMDKRSEDEEQELIRFGNITVHAAQMEMSTFEQAINMLKEEPFKVAYYDNMSVKGNISVEKEGLMFTSIPYEGDNWEVIVDGKKVKPRSVRNAFMAVKLYPGEHYIEFNYKFSVIYIGAVVSLISLMLLILTIIYDKRKPLVSAADDDSEVGYD